MRFRKDIPKKAAVLLDFVQITPLPPSPPFGQLVQIFSDIEFQDLKVSLGLETLYDILMNIYNLKNSLMSKLLAFWRR